MRQDDQLARLGRRVGPSPIVGSPNLAASRSYSRARDLRQAGLGDVRQRAGRGLDVFLAQDVAHAHAQLLVVLEAVQDRVDVFGRRGTARPASLAALRAWAACRARRLSISSSIMPGLLVRMPDRYGLDAHSSTYSRKRGRIEAEQLPQHALAAQRVAHLARGSPASNRDRAWRRWPRAAAARSPPENAGSAASTGSESSPSASAIRLRYACCTSRKRILAQHLGDPLRAAARDRAPGRLSASVCGVVAEGVVQQVVENLAVQLGLAAVVGLERLQRRLLPACRRSPSASPACAARRGSSGSRCVCRSNMICKPVLDLPQKGVVLFQDRPLLVRQAAAPSPAARSLPACCRCAASGRSPPLSNCRNWITNSTSRMPPWPVLTSRSSAPSRCGALLDPPLERLDAGDVGPAQVAAIDPRLELFEKLAAQVQVAGDGPGLDVRLPLPGAARDVVVVQRRVAR